MGVDISRLRPTAQLLSTLAVGSASNMARYKATVLLLPVPVQEILARYKKRDPTESLRWEDTSWPLLGNMGSSMLTWAEETAHLLLKGWTMKHDTRTPDSDLPGSLLEAELQESNEKIFLDLEVIVKAFLDNTANYASGNVTTLTALAGTQFNQTDTCNPDKVFNDALEAITLDNDNPVRVFAARQRVWSYLAQVPAVIDKVRGFTGSKDNPLTAESIARAYNFTDGVSLDAAYDTSPKGSTNIALRRLWGNNAYALSIDPENSLKDRSFGKLLTLYDGIVAAGEDMSNPRVSEVYVQAAYKPVSLNIRAGYKITDAINSSIT